MGRRISPLSRLMEIDVTVPLAFAGLILGGIGFLFGFSVMFQAAVYGFGGLLLVGMPVLWAYSGHKELEQLRDLEDDYGGRVRRGLLINGPSLTFHHRGTSTRIRIIRRHRRYRPDEIEFVTHWPNSHLRLEVFPQGILSVVGHLFGTNDIQIGHSYFDDTYVIKGDDSIAVRSLISAPVQRAIVAMPEQKGLIVRISNGRLQVRAQFYSLTSDAKGFARGALRLYDALEDASASS